MLGVALEGDGNWNTNTIGFISPLHLLYPLLPFLDTGQVSCLSYPLSTSASCVSSIHIKLSIFCINTVLCTFTLFPSYLFFLPPLLNLPLPEMTVRQLIKHCTAGCSHFTSLHSLQFLKFLAQYLLGLHSARSSYYTDDALSWYHTWFESYKASFRNYTLEFAKTSC